MTKEFLSLDKTAQDRLKNAADLIGLLARLHDREPDEELIEGLREPSVSSWIDNMLDSDQSKKALANWKECLGALPEKLDVSVLDILAAEYADIYLNHSYRLAPTGSVWLSEDHLERQAPMFAVREMYEKYGIQVPDWRLRSDDHMVHELQFVAFLLEQGTHSACVDATGFLDQHVLSWMPEFFQKMNERARVPFFAANAELTAVCLEELRDLLEETTGIERPQEIEEEKQKDRITLFDIDVDRPYTPGIAESW